MPSGRRFYRRLAGFIAILVLLASQAQVAYAQSVDTANEGTRLDYVLGVGDLIKIQVHGESDLDLQTRLSEKGTVTFPFLGEFRVLGYTISQLQDAIANGLRGDYLIDPDVQVLVIEYRPFYVNGQVKRPGGYPFVPGLNVRKAAALAGGMTERASTRKIYILREGASEDARAQVGLDAPIYPGDTLIIEEGLF